MHKSELIDCMPHPYGCNICAALEIRMLELEKRVERLESRRDKRG